MKTIWAPWRIKYILEKKQEKCIFCIKKTGAYKKKHLILSESKHSFVILNRYPYSAGHLMVIPERHLPDLDQMNQEEITDFFQMVRYAAMALKNAINPDGLNLGANLGKAAGAGAEKHFHFHIVSRWSGDHNFMPIMGNTMVVSEYPEDTYERLLPHFDSKPIF